MLTILDRQPGYGGLQVQTLDGECADAPYMPGALTVNIADLLARRTGDRWRSTRHRVLPPSQADPDEELISLIVFCESDMDGVITPLAPPVGGGAGHPPVVAGDYYREREAARAVCRSSSAAASASAASPGLPLRYESRSAAPPGSGFA